MPNCEFTANAGKTFSVQAYDPAANTAFGSAIANVQDSGVTTRYRFSLTGTGIKFIVATATNLKIVGYVNLDSPGANGYCSLFDNYEDAAAAAKIKKIGTGSATVATPVTATGKLNEIIIGDDYLSIHERAFEWTIETPGSFDDSGATCWFGGKFEGVNKWRVEGDITDNGNGTLTLTFELERADTADLEPGNYDWSAAIHDADGNQLTTVKSGTNSVTLARKFTNAS
jgi:hypothetical protein